MEKQEFTLDFEKPLRDLERQLEALTQSSREHHVDVSGEVKAIENKIEATKREVYSHLTVWQKVQLARHPQRPYALDYIDAIFTDFQELHGDRTYGDDHALIGGTAYFNRRPVMVLGQQKGRNTRDNIWRNFGMSQPQGYRKAHRLMELAGKFGMPVITFIDTPGAYPGVDAEERHVAEAISANLETMTRLAVPIISIIIGEGGSGGALGIGMGDVILVFEYAYYSVISPEGCAAILWKERAHAAQAAEAMKISARDLLRLEIADEIIEEPFGGAHRDTHTAAENLRVVMARNLRELRKISPRNLLEMRYRKYRAMGIYGEPGAAEKQTEIPEPPSKAG